MTEQFRDAPIFDADQHMYETADALTKFLPEKYSRAGENTEGLTLREMQGKSVEAPAATRKPEDRVKELDRQGVVEALNYPTLGSLVEHSSADDPQLTLAIIHALNEWIHEHWGFDHLGRVFTTPIINLSEVDAAQRELEWVLDHGAKVALIKPGPVNGLHGWLSPALPEFDPLWRDIEAVGLPIVLHASYPPLDDYVNKWEPPRTYDFIGDNARRFMGLPIANPDPAALRAPAHA
ncbi:hypothetical protein BST13_20850 [Mycobacterium aquaticum]|uniref:Amidohydrolase n=1 Tax=Mycobacterium aquaticum TaxID=1927124 RepID=A0A1X0AST6_9MYCO|nr:hypothetical protein BST13_20850 [Mycobacterium aquaticum]